MATKKRVHILTAVNAANVSKSGSTYTIRDVCGAVDGIVMNGMLYGGDQLASGVATLNGKPAPAGHPKDPEGRFISATNGDALLTSYVGAICRNARHEGGRTLVDVVVNEAQAMAHPDGAKLVERLDAAISGNNADPIHVSTGLFVQPIAANGESRGKKYDRIATNLQYDHLAILLNERGAGTPEEGVGMFLNADGQPEPVEQVSINVSASKPDVGKAMKSLQDAIDLHEKHMDGTVPTTGKDGEKSQMKMMSMMKAALAALGGGTSSKGMAMNAAEFPADRRFEGLTGWVRKLMGNGSELSFEQISSGLYKTLPERAWLQEVFARYAVWSDGEGKLWKQDYSVSSDGSVAWSGTAEEVRRQVKYETVTNLERDPMKDKILAALNAAGIKTEGLDESALLAAYNALVNKPHVEALTAANSKLAEIEANAARAADAELTTLATELATNSKSLTAADFKLMGLARCKELKAVAAPIAVGNAGTTGNTGASAYAGYDANEFMTKKEAA